MECISINPIYQEIHPYINLIKDNIDYDILKTRYPENTNILDDLVAIMADVLALPPGATVRIQGNERPVKIVKSMFMKLDMHHIEYVLDCIEKSTEAVHNIRSYLLTALYNAPMTINGYYLTAVNHDLYGTRNADRGT